MDKCAKDVCLKAFKGILDSLTGDFEYGGCDLMTALYDGFPDIGFYQGHRDFMTIISVYHYSLGVLGLTLQTGYKSFDTNNIDQWITEQNKYILDLKSAYDRIV